MAYHIEQKESRYPEAWKRTTRYRLRPSNVSRKQWRSRSWIRTGKIGIPTD